MTLHETIAAVLSLHAALLLAAATGWWYMIKGEILDKQIERATSLAARLRGKVATGLAAKLELFAVNASTEVAQVSLVLNADGTPIEPAGIAPGIVLDSEGFRDAVRDFLDDRNDLMRAYNSAERLISSLHKLQLYLTGIITIWLVTAGAACLYFGLCKLGMVVPESTIGLRNVAIAGLLPPLLLLACTPLIFLVLTRLTILSRK